MSSDNDVRAGLEHRPRGPFAVNEDLALGALRFAWGDAFEIACRSGIWTARRRDGLGGEIEAALPDELNRLMREDFLLRPVTLPPDAGRHRG